jgi:hypothetical protein
MDFKDNIMELSKKIEKYKDRVVNEEMTKTAFILPFFDLLGYDTRNPFEFHAEFTADVADAKGEKVDYAILIDDIPRILVEAKDCNNPLDKADKQLMRYFNVTEAKIGILTNGIIYKFYTDLEQPNIMDSKPFLEINLLNIKDNEISELKKFFRASFDIDTILSSAEELKYSNSIKKLLKSEFEEPSDAFTTFILNEVYDGIKTQKIKDKFSQTIKKSISEFLNDIIRTKLEGALEVNKNEEIKIDNTEELVEVEEVKKNNIVTTEEEIRGLAIVKSLLHGEIELNRISYKDTNNYFNVLLDNNTRKWICRLYFNTDNKYISFPEIDSNGNKTNKEIKMLLENGLDSVYDLKDKLVISLKAYLQ